MNAISNALTQGFSPDNVVQYLLRHFPHARKQIETALARGFTADKIIKFLQGGRNEVNAPVTEHEKTRFSDQKKQRDLQNNILKGAAILGTGIAGGRAIQAGMGAFGTSPTPPMPGAPPQPQGQIPPNPSPAPQSPSPGPGLEQAIPAQAKAPVTQAMQPEAGNMPVPPTQQLQGPDLNAMMEQSGVKSIVDALRDKNPPDVIAGVVRKQLGPRAQSLEQMAQRPLEQLVTEYVQSSPAPPDIKERIAGGVQTPGMNPTNILQPQQPQTEAQQPEPQKEKPKLNIQLSKDGRFTPISESIKPQKLPSNAIGRQLSDVTYEQKYKDLNPKEKEAFKIIDDAIDKTAKHLVSGKTFTDLLPMKEGSVVQLSTAEDVLRTLLGVPSKYNLMTPEEQEEAFNTFQGITPNVIWNTISLIDPRIQKIDRPNPSPKGAKAGKTEMSPNDFRRFLAHSVIGLMEKNKDFGPRAKMIVSVVNMLDKFEKKPSKTDTFPDFQNLSDDEFNTLMASVSDEEVKKYR